VYCIIDLTLNIFLILLKERERGGKGGWREDGERERKRKRETFLYSYVFISLFLNRKNFLYFKHICLLNIIFLDFIFVNFNVTRPLIIFELLYSINYASCQTPKLFSSRFFAYQCFLFSYVFVR